MKAFAFFAFKELVFQVLYVQKSLCPLCLCGENLPQRSAENGVGVFYSNAKKQRPQRIKISLFSGFVRSKNPCVLCVFVVKFPAEERRK